MKFNISQFDDVEEADERAFENYQDTLVELFFESTEGQAYRAEFPDADPGFWAESLVHYGYYYVGVTVPRMDKGDVEEIVTDIFPRKISLHKPEDADDGIPELMAFWQYLGREYGLPQTNDVLELLQEIAPEFRDMMNDPANFGMAKSFFMAGRDAGFDMTNEEEMHKFVALCNASVMSGGAPGGPFEEMGGLPGLFGEQKKRSGDASLKKKRKAAKSTRKKRRRK